MLLEGNLNGLQHLGMFVTDIEKSKAFYKQFGFKEVLVKTVPNEPDDVELAFLEQGGFTIELVQFGGDMKQQIANREDGQIDHVALNVKDVDKAYADVLAAGFEVLEENAPVAMDLFANGVKFFSIRGPDGEKVEFNQML
jgi:lactoylglutathione lyase